ncbi:MAG: ATP-binding protein [Chitinophagaceae bacterium]|nr:ATP-binding protein [Panacibacter sp.]
MRFFLIFLLPLLSFQPADGQLNKDSLLLSLKNPPNDSTKADLLRSLSEYYVRLKPDTSMILARQAIELARKARSAEIEGSATFTLAKVYEFLGNYTTALELFLESLKINESVKDESMVASCLLFIGDIYKLQSNHAESLSYYYKSLERSANISDSVDKHDLVAWIDLGLGDTYESMNRLDSAEYYINSSYDLIKKYGIPYLAGRALKTYGNIYSRNGQLAKSMQYYRASIVELTATNDLFNIAQSTLGIARLFQKSGLADSSKFYAWQSLSIAQRGGFLLEILNSAQFLSDHYKELRKIDSAFYYQQITVSAKDSLFSREKIIDFQNVVFNEQLNNEKIAEAREQVRNEIKFYVLFAGLAVLLLIAIILLRNIRNKKKANDLLHLQKKEIDEQKQKIEKAFNDLSSTQTQLIQSEKMASLGELTAGIAHEIQNPLNFINNFSDVNTDLIREMEEELAAGNQDIALDIAKDIRENEQKINHHGKRAEAIVKGMLQHSRSSSGQKESININRLADEYIRLAFHGHRAKDKSFSASFNTEFDAAIDKFNVMPQEMGRVLLNLYNNAFYAVNEKKKTIETQNPDAVAPVYEPLVTVSTKKEINGISITVADNGNGIPQKVIDKIFQPFFTTKPTGQGTGLGLSLSYDIVKAHGGGIKIETTEGEGTKFIISLPNT